MAKKQASYRIVVADSRAPRDGKFVAILGHYNPLTDPYTLKVDQEKAIGWLKDGAELSDTARGLLAKAGIIAAFEAAKKVPAEAAAAAAPKPARAPRAARTEAPRLVRPAKKEGAEAPAAAASTSKKAPAKTKSGAARQTAKGGAKGKK